MWKESNERCFHFRGIVSPQDRDSLNSTSWRKFLDRPSLQKAWTTPEGSPYCRYMKLKTLNGIDKVIDPIPRYSYGEYHSEQVLDELIKSGLFNPKTAVVLDSGGAHSVAMAALLASRLLYQTVPMLDWGIFEYAGGAEDQDLAALLYFAKQMQNQRSKIAPVAPPAFILNIHRNATVPKHMEDIEGKSYCFTSRDFPTAQLLTSQAIQQVVYINEGQSNERSAKDLTPSLSGWERGGLKIQYIGIPPWDGFKGHFRDPFIPPIIT